MHSQVRGIVPDGSVRPTADMRMGQEALRGLFAVSSIGRFLDV